jgi:peptide/nickel transport system permease protein
MRLQRYILWRLVQMIPTVIGIIIVNFFIIHLAPGDPARAMAGEMASPENIEALRKTFGLDRSLPEQLFTYVWRVLQGDLGYSYNYLTPVLTLILERLPQTLLLVAIADVLSIVVGTFMGAYAASKYPSRTDSSIWITAILFYSLPIFWFGLLLILIFSRTLRWFPSGGNINILEKQTGLDLYMDMGWHLVLPVLTLAAYNLPIFLRIGRASVIDTMREDFITTARAIGLTENQVFLRHGLRNALLPSVTVAGLTLGFVVTGAILTETVFSYPGIGLLTWQAISNRDYPVLLGVFLFASFSVVIASFITDIVYAVLDPRVTYK